MRTCKRCGSPVPEGKWCSDCLAAFPGRRQAETLTADEREAEMRKIGDSAEIPFDMMHQRIEELVGRSVWTHEMGMNWEGLCRESRWEGQPATMEEIIGLLPAEKTVILVDDRR